MKKLAVAIAIAALGACGGKAKKPTTPDTKAPAGAMGGATYGGTTAAPTNGSGSANATKANPNHPDPCAGQ
ncbi:MAG TPA: hypothetical protein VGF94_26080 [Kofleriaceae bacterium]